MPVVALDLGGTRIKIGIVDGGRLAAVSVIDAISGAGLIRRLPAIEAEIATLISKTGVARENLRGLGISMPGIVDPVNSGLLSVNEKYNDAVSFDFPRWAEERWHLPLVIENDARSALIGEWQYGAGRGCEDLVMLTLGTGIGSAAIIGGRILRGKHFQAGILSGHFTINLNGGKCNCGNIGCAESEASSWQLAEIARNHPDFRTSPLSTSETIDYKTVFDLAGKGDALSRELVAHGVEVWSSCVVNLIHAYDPELVIIGGGIMRSASDILPEISSRVNDRAWVRWGKVRIVPAEQTDFAALLGVGYLFNQK